MHFNRSALCTLWVLMCIVVYQPVSLAKGDARPDPRRSVRVQGRLLKYEDRPWCTHDQSAGGKIHGLGESPWGQFRILSPAIHAGRKISVLFKCGYLSSFIPELRAGLGRTFVMFLPRDFLLGESEQIEDCNIDPAKRWHKVVATTYPNKPGSDNQDGSRAAAEQAVAADGAAPRR